MQKKAKQCKGRQINAKESKPKATLRAPSVVMGLSVSIVMASECARRVGMRTDVQLQRSTGGRGEWGVGGGGELAKPRAVIGSAPPGTSALTCSWCSRQRGAVGGGKNQAGRLYLAGNVGLLMG